VPILISDSQTDWFKAEEYNFDRFRANMGNHIIRHSFEECAPGSPKRDSEDCHSVKEADPRLVGKEWASLKIVNLTALGVETIADLLEVQVC
jgi:hypothetical protein